MEIRIEQEQGRLDRFLTERFPGVNRSRWEAWIREGRVRVDGVPAAKPGLRLRAGALVETEMPPAAPPALHLEPEALDLPTLFEDARLWIVDKPPDLVVHPGPGHPDRTVVNALLWRLRAPAVDLGGDTLAGGRTVDEDNDGDEEVPPLPWPGLVHRLDRFTTGCLALAKDAAAQASLQAQFKARSVAKIYLALARNGRRLPEAGSLLVDEPLARHRAERMKMTVSAAGRPAQTRFRVLARSAGVALVECELLTGRTHQIRVHLRHLGSPILGDGLYGGPAAWLDPEGRSLALPHPMLHAWRLALDHPGSGQRIEVQAPLPEAFRRTAEALGLPLPG
ncbi:MAG: RluA family pseudouridine synthase [Acidobacteria bacterium]|nr:RluA family pseudouridine synthase [Acidobacteriota bacterium]